MKSPSKKLLKSLSLEDTPEGRSVKVDLPAAPPPIDFRQQILATLKSERLSRYMLTKRLKGIVPARTIYDFLSGKSEINSKALVQILYVMGFTLHRPYDKLHFWGEQPIPLSIRWLRHFLGQP